MAALSKYHFHRLYTATYGRTPAAHLAERRIERAQDLLRSTNLTVTEICFAVGYASLGSFSSRFTEIVGESPTAFQGASGNSVGLRVELKPAAVEVDGRLEVLPVAESAC